MRVSTETIYQAIYIQSRGGLRQEVAAALRTGRTRRVQHRSPEQRTSRFVDAMVMISERPAEVADRSVPGHWEGDLIVGTRPESAIVTLVERSTRYLLLGHLPGGHTAEEVRDVLVPLIGSLPTHLRGSLTWDQGCEMAAHKQFSVATGVPVYFCDPHSPCQHSATDLENVAHRLNSRPRKKLGWKTPAERLLTLAAMDDNEEQRRERSGRCRRPSSPPQSRRGRTHGGVGPTGCNRRSGARCRFHHSPHVATGPWKVGGTDLAFPVRMSGGRFGFFCGDTFESPAPGGAGWRSPVLRFPSVTTTPTSIQDHPD